MDQIIEHEQACNGFFNCIDRSDESGCKKYSSNFNYKTFKICTVDGTNNYKNHAKNGSFGFQCEEICLDWDIWCNWEMKSREKVDSFLIEKCPLILDQIHNLELCSDLTFWQDKKCNTNDQRCKGNVPGQCGFSNIFSLKGQISNIF